MRVDQLQLGPLGYASAAKSSYPIFARLKSQGIIPAHIRFQVALPTPLAPVDFFGVRDQAQLAPLYERQMLAEVAEIAEAVPADELAIQWDTAVEFAMLEGIWPSPFGSPSGSFEPIAAMLARIGNAVPPRVELGYHLCYGDAAQKHFVEPRDSQKLAAVASQITRRVQRPVSWIHFPVPRDRTDAAYLDAMRQAEIASETEVYVGLVHPGDTVADALSRIATAQHVLERPFGIAAECGLGRSLPSSVPTVLRRHAQLSAEVVPNR